jgi:hypothetical protein
VVVVTAGLDADKDDARRREDDAIAAHGTVGDVALPGIADCLSAGALAQSRRSASVVEVIVLGIPTGVVGGGGSGCAA